MKRRSGTSPHRLVASGVVIGAAIVLAACRSGASALPSLPAVPSLGLPSSLASSLPQAFVQFSDQGGSGITGAAVVSDSGGQSTVLIGVVGGDLTAAIPAVLFEGDCASFGTTGPSASAATSSASIGASASIAPSSSSAAHFELQDVVNGTSTSTVPVSISELTSSPHSIALLAPSGPSVAPGSGAPASASALAGSLAPSESAALPEAPSPGSSASILVCGEITAVAPSGLPSLLPGGSAVPSTSAGPHDQEFPSSPGGSMTEPSPST